MKMKIIEKLKDEKFLLKVIAMCTTVIIFIPTLYSFTFLGAFWDPYARLNKISSVAFVNLDKPVYKNGKKYNVGQQLEDKLKDNTDFEWEFVDYNTAKNGVKNTSYYAMIVVPKDFSKKISNSIVDGNFKKPDIIYEGNAGRNYIFSLLTKRGAESIESQVEQSITKETSKALIDNLYDVKKSTKTAADSSKQLADGSNKLLNGSNQILDGITNKNTGADGMPLGLQNGSEQISTGLYDAKTGVLSAQGAVSQIEPKLNSYRGLLSLLNVQNMNSLKTMAIDTNDLNSSTNTVDLLGIKQTLNSINPSSFASINNIMTDYKAINLNGASNINFKNFDPLINDVNNMSPMLNYFSNNSNKIKDLLIQTQPLENMDLSKLNPMMDLLNHSQDMGNLLDTASNFGKMDTSSLNSLSPLLNTQNVSVLNGLLNTASSSFGGSNGQNLTNFLTAEQSIQSNINSILNSNLSNDDKINRINLVLQQASNAGLTPNNVNSTMTSLINTSTNMNATINNNAGTLSQIQNNLTTNNINNVNALLYNLSKAQQYLNSPSTQNTLLNAKTALSTENVANAQSMMGSLLNAQKALNDNKDVLAATQNMLKYIPTQNDLSASKTTLDAIQSLLNQNGGEDSTIRKINNLQSDVNSSANALASMSAALNNPSVQSQLKNAPETLDKLSKLKSEVNDNQKLLGVAKDYLNDGNVTMANNLIAQVPSMVDKFNELSGGIVKLSDGSNRLNSGINTLADGSIQLNNGIGTLNDGNNKFNDALNSSYKDLNKNLKFSSSKFSKFLSAPINLKDNSINTVKNYGEGLAPYFVALSAWLGALFVNAIIIISEMLDVFKKRFNNSPIIEYTLGIILVSLQAFMFTIFLRVGLGLTTSVNPALLYLNNIFISCVYYSVLFGLAQAFGIGSVPISFVLLIIQLSSCAGTFPVATAYPFYRIVGKFIPMTYTVNTLRMVISGINTKVYMQNFNILILFAVVTLACGTLIGYLKKCLKAKYITKNSDSTAA